MPLNGSASAMVKIGARRIRRRSMRGSQHRRRTRLHFCARKRHGAAPICSAICAIPFAMRVSGRFPPPSKLPPRSRSSRYWRAARRGRLFVAARPHIFDAGRRSRNGQFRRRIAHRTQHRHGSAHAHDDRPAHRLAGEGRSVLPGQTRFGSSLRRDRWQPAHHRSGNEISRAPRSRPSFEVAVAQGKVWFDAADKSSPRNPHCYRRAMWPPRRRPECRSRANRRNRIATELWLAARRAGVQAHVACRRGGRIQSLQPPETRHRR